MWYGNVRVQPISLVDDVAKVAEERMEAQAGITLMEILAKRKGLSYNFDQINYLVAGRDWEKGKNLEHDLEKIH